VRQVSANCCATLKRADRPRTEHFGRIYACAMPDLYGQVDYAIRLDWGPVGAQATQADVAVVVDVLSFSTSVCIAVERGMRVYPYSWKGPQAEAFARQRDAVLAVGRLEATKDGAVPAPSLSPAGLLACTPAPRIVLPSPNGSTIADALLETDATIAVGCLRNARAVADWLATDLEQGRSVAVIAAGERWNQDDSLRPALEDHLGAGAILSTLTQLGHGHSMSPEASAAAELFKAGQERLLERMSNCVGGRELARNGFQSDVDTAAALNSSKVVPVLTDGSFGLASKSSCTRPPHRRMIRAFKPRRAT
jgi:2-phosphosulfolactate phosphatase